VVKNQVNIQDQFLNKVRKDRIRVTMELVTGHKLEGVIQSFDNFSIILRGECDQLIYKHAISTLSANMKLEFSEVK
jgi:host factor-I protein